MLLLGNLQTRVQVNLLKIKVEGSVLLSTITSTLEIVEKEEVLKTEYVKVMRIGSRDNVENVIN